MFHINSDEIAYADSDRALLLSCLPRFSMTDKNHLIDAASIKYLSDESFPLDNQRDTIRWNIEVRYCEQKTFWSL